MADKYKRVQVQHLSLLWEQGALGRNFLMCKMQPNFPCVWGLAGHSEGQHLAQNSGQAARRGGALTSQKIAPLQSLPRLPTCPYHSL